MRGALTEEMLSVGLRDFVPEVKGGVSEPRKIHSKDT